MDRARKWWCRALELLVLEVRRPDGTRYVTSIDPVGFGECWLPIEIVTCDTAEVSHTT